MKTIVRFAVPGLLAVAMLQVPAAQGQILDKLKERVKDTAEREVLDAVDRKVSETVRCVFNDEACINKAKQGGGDYVLTDSDGNVITDDGGKPVLDPQSAQSAMDRPGHGVWANYDFVPGNRVLFAEDFESDNVGDFPRRLEFVKGNMEIVEMRDRRMLRATGNDSRFAVLLSEQLPERFTIEFELHDPATEGGTIVATETLPSGRWAYRKPHINFGHWRGSGVWIDRDPASAATEERFVDQVMPVRAMVDGQYAKLYVGETRVGNHPRVDLPRTNRVEFSMDAESSRPIYIGNIRIAAGGRDLYDKLASVGRVVTRGILFDTGSDRIRPESTPTLEEIADMLNDHPSLSLAIEGHTDSQGEKAFNQDLSERRARAVRKFLVDHRAIDASRLEATGYGEDRPTDSNETAEGRQNNRRVELVKL